MPLDRDAPSDELPTPGPWRLAGKGTVRHGKHGWVARVTWDNQAANARLIVAAPDLLDACQRCISLLETVEAKALVGDEGCLWPVEIMRAAIAKATSHDGAP